MSKIQLLSLTLLVAVSGLFAACGGPDEGEVEGIEAQEAAAASGYATQQSVNNAYNACLTSCAANPPPYNKRDPLSGGPCTMYCCSAPGVVGVTASGEVVMVARCL